MNRHLTEDERIGYVHHTLTDAERESFDQHLATCAACQAELETHTQQRAAFQARLQAELATVSPSPRMRFAAIAPRVRKSQRGIWLRQPLAAFVAFAPTLAAVTGALLAIMGLLRNVTWPAMGLHQDHSLSLPFAAGLMFGAPVLSQWRQERRPHHKQAWTWMAAIALWLGTAVLGLYEIALLHEMLLRAYVRFGPSSAQLLWQAEALSSWGVFFMGAAWIALVIGGGEYHYRHIGRRASWRLFAWTVGAQLALLALPLIV